MASKEISHAVSPPSMGAWLAKTGGNAALVDAPPPTSSASADTQYPEETPQGNAPESATHPIMNGLQNLGDMSAADRGETGMLVGAKLGEALHGPEHGLIGAAIGANLARAKGISQSAEKKVTKQMTDLVQNLEMVGIVSKDGQFSFGEEDSVPILAEYPMANSLEDKNHKIYEIDKTNPLSKKTEDLIDPIAKFMASSFLNDSPDKKTIGNIKNMLTNIVLQDTTNLQMVFSRINNLKTKIGFGR